MTGYDRRRRAVQRSAVRIYRDHREPALYRATSSGVEHEIPD